MTPEERDLLINTANKLNDFLDVYYKTNFPSLFVVTKDTDLQKTQITSLSVKDKVGFFGTSPIAKQIAITKPTGGATIDAEARTAINTIIDTLKAFGFTA